MSFHELTFYPHGLPDNLTAIIVGHIETILSFPVPLMRPMHYLS